MTKPVDSWGRLSLGEVKYQTASPYTDTTLNPMMNAQPIDSILAHGMGRSYGDSALNSSGISLQMTRQDRILNFDLNTGILRAQSGITLDEILSVIVPQGWFLPVTPGSKFVTLGGAVANDVHGKNHHQVGSLGNFITKFALSRSDKLRICSPTQNKTLFTHTLGGLGLTGIIEWVELQLVPIKSAYLDVENIPFDNLEAFISLSRDNQDWPYSVAWVDCFGPPKKRGRGIFTRARFSDYGGLVPHNNEKNLTWPITTPAFLLNRLTISMFNRLYQWRPGARYVGRQHYDPFFYPLDGINNWNKMYGRKGFYQHQCLIPTESAQSGINALLGLIKKSGQGSFLAVLKSHGQDNTPGVMSFCKTGPGISLALDFANKGDTTRKLLSEMEACVLDHGGRIYVAKDATMSAKTFQKSYPAWEKLEAMRDPLINSSFWVRTTGAMNKSEANDE